jgi:hypothetical protein
MFSQLVHLPTVPDEFQRNPESKPRSEKLEPTKPLKTLFLNPPSFEQFDDGASSRSPARAKSNLIGTRFGSLILLACSIVRVWSMLRLTISPGSKEVTASNTRPSVGLKHKEDTKTRVQVPIPKEVSGQNVEGYAC